jgi:hypothetical protein
VKDQHLSMTDVSVENERLKVKNRMLQTQLVVQTDLETSLEEMKRELENSE